MDRGQITVYVIIGIVLLIIVAVVFTFVSKTKESFKAETTATETASSVIYFVNTCQTSQLKDAVYSLAKYGLKAPSSQQEWFDTTNIPDIDVQQVPYYMKDGVSFFPSLGAIEKDLARIADTGLDTCLQGLSGFQEQGFEAAYSGVSSTVYINEDDVALKSVVDAKLKKGNSEFEVRDFDNSLKYDLKEKYEILEEFMIVQMQDTTYFQISFLADLADEHNFVYKIYNDGQETVIVELIFDDYKQIGGKSLEIFFALK